MGLPFMPACPPSLAVMSASPSSFAAVVPRSRRWTVPDCRSPFALTTSVACSPLLSRCRQPTALVLPRTFQPCAQLTSAGPFHGIRLSNFSITHNSKGRKRKFPGELYVHCKSNVMFDLGCDTTRVPQKPMRTPVFISRTGFKMKRQHVFFQTSV